LGLEQDEIGRKVPPQEKTRQTCEIETLGDDMEIGEERIYVIPLRKVKEVPKKKRSPRAMTEVRSFLVKHTKTDDVALDRSINEHVWRRGIEKPPSKVRVRAVKEEIEKEEGKRIRVNAFLAE